MEHIVDHKKEGNKKMKQPNMRKLSLLLCLLLIFSTVLGGCGVSSRQPYQKALDAVQAYLEKTVTEPMTGSVGGEWAVIALTCGGGKVSDTFLRTYRENTAAVVREAQGVLNTATGYKYTEYARILLGWTAAGGDPTNVGGYDFLEKLTDLRNVCRQGINGPIWALIAYDCGGYEIPDAPEAPQTQQGGGAAAASGRTAAAPVQTTREALLRYLLDNRTADGGWTLSGEEADVDLTAMALTAMAPYVCGDETLCGEVTKETLTEVREAADQALSCLADKKLPDGSFESWGSVNAESCAQVLTALSALGIDAAEDDRFAGTLEALLAFQQKDGGFTHVVDGGTNLMATEQAAYALAAYERVKNGEPRLFDMR